MGLNNIINISYYYLKNIVAVELYKSFNTNFTFPVKINAQINNQCNSRCNMCDVWRQKVSELPSFIWINTFKKLKSEFRTFNIAFTGGEVLLKKDAYDIFEYCHKSNLPFTITTNGKLLTSDNVNRLLELNPLNINISLDSLDPVVYKQIRGQSYLEQVKSNIDYLMKQIGEQSFKTKVFLKTVINSYNVDELPLIAQYAHDKKISGITFDPVRRRRGIFIESKIPQFERLIDIDFAKLTESIDKLALLKKQGINILNSEERMKYWFKTKSYKEAYSFCSAPLREIYINNEGFVRLCDFTESNIGNISEQDILHILKSRDAVKEKKRLSHCQNPCDYCIHRNLSDYLRIFISYLKN